MEPLPIFLSLAFSLTADFVFLNTPWELLGIFLFILVQYFHRSLLHIPPLLFFRHSLILTLFFIFAAFLLKVKSSLLLTAALFYFSLLLENFYHAVNRSFRLLPRIFSVCLSMLLVCDLHVGLYNLPRFIPNLPTALQYYCRQIAQPLIWLFYIPSQLIMVFLLIISLRRHLLRRFLLRQNSL